MVSSPARAWRLPAAPASLGAQIEAAFALWLRSAWPLLPFSLLHSIAGLLPLLTLGDIAARTLRIGGRLAMYALDPSQPDPLDAVLAWVQALQDWGRAPLTWGLVLLSLLLTVYAVTGVMLRQHRIAHGTDRGFTDAALLALRRFPAALGAWALYGLVMLACTALLGGFCALVVSWAWNLDGLGLAGLLLLFLLGSLVLSVPLAWASVAFGFAPLLASIEGGQPFATHARSARRVRGHWVQAATMMTVPMLVYAGAGGTVSSLVYAAVASLVFALGGVQALLDGQWLGWSQWLAAVPLAFGFPLAFAGFVVGLHDLSERDR